MNYISELQKTSPRHPDEDFTSPYNQSSLENNWIQIVQNLRLPLFTSNLLRTRIPPCHPRSPRIDHNHLSLLFHNIQPNILQWINHHPKKRLSVRLRPAQNRTILIKQMYFRLLHSFYLFTSGRQNRDNKINQTKMEITSRRNLETTDGEPAKQIDSYNTWNYNHRYSSNIKRKKLFRRKWNEQKIVYR